MRYGAGKSISDAAARSVRPHGHATSELAASEQRGLLAQFGRDEAGTLVIFALMLAVLMLMMGGLAVDLMRYESRRTSLQNTLDRSTLAAAALNQDMVPRAVVDDYFLKAGLMDYLTSVTVTQGLNYRSVKATAAADTDPLFLGMMGINKFDALGHSGAEQRVNKVEVMMVLDVSGSMNSNSRLVNLKVAAKDFVATVLNNDPDHMISIGMVPFNGQVNLGTTLLAQFNAINPPGTANVNCIDLPLSAYDNTTLSQYAWATSVAPTALSMTADADTYDGPGTTAPNGANKWCPVQPGNIVRLPSQNVATLQSNIDGLSAIGATSINAGLKWGLGLIDPESRPIYASLIGGGTISGNLAGRPFDYEDKDAMKVIVLMTDGEHFLENRVAEAKKSGFSDVYKSNADGNYSAFVAGHALPNQYYVPHLAVWQAVPWSNATNSGTFVQLTYPQLWVARNLQYVTCYLLSAGVCNTTAYATLLSQFKSTTPTATMDTQLQTICNLAKGKNVIIYGIAFEASTNGQTQIRNCSTDGANGSHYFNAAGLQISAAFSAIANNISQLRLTQ